MKIGIFGCAADPFHFGHEMLIKYLVMNQIVDQVWITLPEKHAFNKDMAPLWARQQFVYEVLGSKFIADNCKVIVDTFPFTYDFLRHNKEELKKYDVYLVIGEDNGENIDKWHRYEGLLNEYKFIVFPREYRESGWHEARDWYSRKPHIFLDEFPRLAASSTEIRRLFSLGHPASHLTNVHNYAKNHRLYGLS